MARGKDAVAARWFLSRGDQHGGSPHCVWIDRVVYDHKQAQSRERRGACEMR
jgi:hypothetical protein